jgi:hypothetical protein
MEKGVCTLLLQMFILQQSSILNKFKKMFFICSLLALVLILMDFSEPKFCLPLFSLFFFIDMVDMSSGVG